MENHRILKTSKRALVSKSSFIGGILAFSFTFMMLFFYRRLPPGESYGGLFLVIPWIATVLPTFGIYYLFGWDWGVGSVNEVPTRVFWSVVVVNSVIGALFGAIIGCAIHFFRRRKGGIKCG